MTSEPRESFLTGYVAAIEDGGAAVFAGAGLSKPAGLVDWRGLLRSVAEELELNLEVEDDLVAVAQYHVNASNQSRDRLNKLILDEFTEAARTTPAHASLARLPIRTYWTSNYDALLEQGLRDAGRQVDVKTTNSSLGVSRRRRDAVVYKMHGDASDPANVILTRDDYEAYATRRGPMRARLQSDLMDKTFLFLGFSFADPNLNLVLGEIRAALHTNPRTHYALFRRESGYEGVRQRHRVNDLKRYGVRSVLVDDYAEVPELLGELERRYARRFVVVSGAADEPAPLGQVQLARLCSLLGAALVEHDYNVVSGFGKGIGSPLVAGAAESIFRSDEDGALDQRLRLRPFPQTVTHLDPEDFKRRYREQLVAGGGFLVVIAGNRVSVSGGAPEISPGVLAEYDIAVAKRLFPIPVAASGWAAQEIWSRIDHRFAEVYPEGTPREPFDRLADSAASPEALVDAVVELLHALTPRERKRRL